MGWRLGVPAGLPLHESPSGRTSTGWPARMSRAGVVHRHVDESATPLRCRSMSAEEYAYVGKAGRGVEGLVAAGPDGGIVWSS